jgi:hypothetical protein
LAKISAKDDFGGGQGDKLNSLQINSTSTSVLYRALNRKNESIPDLSTNDSTTLTLSGNLEADE